MMSKKNPQPAKARMEGGRVVITRHTAWCSGVDAANRQMRSGGRSAWNRADRDLAIETQFRLMRAGGLLDADDRPTPLFFQAQGLDARYGN